MDLYEIYQTFKDERDCHDYLISLRWGVEIKCVYCDSLRVYRRKSNFGFKCRDCNHSFTVTTGTIFHSSKIPLLKWFLAISIILAAKKGISSLQLARTIMVNRNTAWYMQKRLRSAMKSDIILSGIVEIDETYIGGNLGNMKPHQIKKRNPFKGGMGHKIPVLGLLERGTGRVILDTLGHACRETIRPKLEAKITKESMVITDVFGAHFGLDKHFHKQIKMNHSAKQRAVGKYSLCNIEGFFSTIKRAIFGQYHVLSAKHLQSYMDEIAFKKNNSQDNIFNTLLIRACAVF